MHKNKPVFKTTQLMTIMEEKIIELLTKVLESLANKPDSTIITAIIGLGGMLFVALMSIFTQIIITKKIIKSDFQKIQTQIKTEYDFKTKQEWIIQFRKIIADLVTETDPERNTTFSKIRLISLINQSQLMLNPTIFTEKEIFGLITHLGMVVSEWYDDNLKRTHENYWENMTDYSYEIYQIQSLIIDKTRILLCSK